MRLIDADALRKEFVSYRACSGEVIQDRIDAAPTISCEACEYQPTCECGIAAEDEGGCSRFEPKP